MLDRHAIFPLIIAFELNVLFYRDVSIRFSRVIVYLLTIGRVCLLLWVVLFVVCIVVLQSTS